VRLGLPGTPPPNRTFEPGLRRSRTPALGSAATPAAVAVLVLLTVGCAASRTPPAAAPDAGDDGSDAGPPPDAGGPAVDAEALVDAIDRFERATRALVCSRSAQCDPRYLCAGGRMRTRGVSASQVAAARAGRLRFDEAAAGACVSALLARRCGDPYPAPCLVGDGGMPQAPITGTQGADAPCREDLECAAAFYCDRSTCEGRCRSKPGVGELCGAFGTDCQPGTFCDWHGDPDAPGRPPTCAPRRGEGEACGDGWMCRRGLSCIDGSCADLPPAAGPDGACERSQDCRAGLACEGGRCHPRPAPAEELRCAGDPDCEPGERCEEAVVGTGIRLCVAVETFNERGEACDNSGDCLYYTHACIDGVCVPRGRPGEACGSLGDPPCELNVPCLEGRCGLPVGEACEPSCPWCGGVCAGWCRPAPPAEPTPDGAGGLCAPPLTEGELCGIERGFGACGEGLECRRGVTVREYRCRPACADPR